MSHLKKEQQELQENAAKQLCAIIEKGGALESLQKIWRERGFTRNDIISVFSLSAKNFANTNNQKGMNILLQMPFPEVEIQKKYTIVAEYWHEAGSTSEANSALTMAMRLQTSSAAEDNDIASVRRQVVLLLILDRKHEALERFSALLRGGANMLNGAIGVANSVAMNDQREEAHMLWMKLLEVQTRSNYKNFRLYLDFLGRHSMECIPLSEGAKKTLQFLAAIGPREKWTAFKKLCALLCDKTSIAPHEKDQLEKIFDDASQQASVVTEDKPSDGKPVRSDAWEVLQQKRPVIQGVNTQTRRVLTNTPAPKTPHLPGSPKRRRK